MNDFFVWLFNEYVVPQVEEDSFPHEYQVEKRRWMEAIERLSSDVLRDCGPMRTSAPTEMT